MNFVLVGLSHRTAPLEVREKVYIPESGVGECVRRLVDREVIESGVLLSTCNRTELYAVSTAPDRDQRLLNTFAWWPHDLPFDDWQRYAYQFAGEEAMAHLFRVACGLDSMVVGEGQILGQLKGALEQARQSGVLDSSLQIILRGALRAGKRVRHETELGRRAVSVSHAAVEQARQVLGDLTGRHVLLVGAGEMSEVALRLLRNQGIGDVYVASRTLERAEKVAHPMGARAIAFAELDAVIENIDLVLSSSNAPTHLLDVARVEGLQRQRGARPLLILDIAVPRDVDPAAAGVAGVHLFNIDDLRSAAERNLKGREASIPVAERIVREELARTQAALEQRDAAPTVTALVRRFERIRDQELARYLGQVPQTDTRTREAMRGLADGLTAKFLHGPVRQLKESPDPRLDGAVFGEAFDLDE